MAGIFKSGAGALGLGNQNGTDAGNPFLAIPGGADAAKQTMDRQATLGNNNLASALGTYGQGQGSLSDAIAQSGFQPGQVNEATRMAALDPSSSLRYATDQINGDSNLSRLYGGDPNSLISQTLGQEKQQANQGFSLQPEDYDAYGQGSGNIARLFGTSNNNLAQSMADRGLSSSGVAGQNFSNSMGNQNEQLGQLQTQIAQQRMQTNLQRLGQTQQFLGQLGQQQGNEINNQFNRESNGANSEQNSLQNANSLNLQNNEAMQNQNNQQYQQRDASKPVNLGDAVIGGAFQGLSGGLTNRVGSATGTNTYAQQMQGGVKNSGGVAAVAGG